MAISPMRYNGGFLSNSQVNGKKQPTATEKEVQDLKKEQYTQKTPRELTDLPYGFTVLPSDSKFAKGLRAKDLFAVQYNSATTLSDGSKLIRPVCLALGKVDITPTENGEYEVVVKPPSGHAIHRTVSEEELITNKTLARGSVKAIEDEKGRYIVNIIDIDGQERTYKTTEKGCLDLLQANLLYM